jgi:hypothetical protein
MKYPNIQRSCELSLVAHGLNPQAMKSPLFAVPARRASPEDQNRRTLYGELCGFVGTIRSLRRSE